MGEVYRAQDTRLGRDVALKFLPEAFAQDRERLARFEREAQSLASLNHPHIAAIHGFEDAGGQRFLVLEYVPGSTLADRVAAGPVPLDESLEICRQAAEALEAAHDKGIIHRDLKPANVKVTPEGKVKILDFGLAKPFDSASAFDPANSPTLTATPTRTGVIMGTAAYMSPEQTRGRAHDRRTDIWAFGCVCYELLTGKMAFPGETVTDMLAAVVKSEPDWTLLPAETPESIRRLLRRCLTKDAKLRLRDIGEARITFEEVLSGKSEAAESLAITPAASATPRTLLWALAGVAVLALAAAAWGWLRSLPEPARHVVRFTAALPPETSLTQSFRPAVAISPDGARIAFTGYHAGIAQLFVRELKRAEATPVPGTDGATGPFFSPDGQWVGFVSSGKLKKVPVGGGPVVTLCDAVDSRGATWALDDTILLSTTVSSGLLRVSAAGGALQALFPLDVKAGEGSIRWPHVLPDGEHVLFNVTVGGTSTSASQIGIASLKTGQRRTLLPSGLAPHFVPPGHLVFLQDNTVMAAPFDLQRLELTGAPAPVLEGVNFNGTSGAADFAVARDATLVYLPSGGPGGRVPIWVDRKGTSNPMPAPPQGYETPRISPDGRRVAFTARSANVDIWVYDMTSGTPTRLTFNPGEDETPAWTPDGKRIVYAALRGTQRQILWKPADGAGSEEVLLDSDPGDHLHIGDVSPDGKLVLFSRPKQGQSTDIWMLPLIGDRKPQPLLASPANEDWPVLSPDGRWLAYVSNESGRDEVYVQPFPDLNGKWQISSEGGGEPAWARNGKELFYRNGEKLMVASIQTQPNFSSGAPRLLFHTTAEPGALSRPNFDVALNGEQLLMVQTPQSGQTKFNVVLNWIEEVKQRVPLKK
jgi:serine/threonine-protein kinase